MGIFPRAEQQKQAAKGFINKSMFCKERRSTAAAFSSGSKEAFLWKSSHENRILLLLESVVCAQWKMKEAIFHCEQEAPKNSAFLGGIKCISSHTGLKSLKNREKVDGGFQSTHCPFLGVCTARRRLYFVLFVCWFAVVVHFFTPHQV